MRSSGGLIVLDGLSMKMNLSWFGGGFALAVLAIAPITAAYLLPAAAQAQTVYAQPENTLSVTGQAIEMIPTTLAEVRLGVRIEADTAEAAQQQAASQSSAVVEFLRSQNVEKLQTTGVSLSPRYDYVDDRQVLRGYEATNTVSFRAENEVAGEVIDGAVKAGATAIDGISFTADAAAISAARQRALTAAVADAEAQGNTVLSALGLSRKSILNVTIGSVSAPAPRPAARAALQSADFANEVTPIVGQEQSINAHR